jgi:predicted ArsR family transcriptional regulator
VALLVAEIGNLAGTSLAAETAPSLRKLVLRRIAERLAQDYQPLLGKWPLRERVAFVTEVLHAEGGLAEWQSGDRGFEIRDYSCLFAGAGQTTCDWHEYFLSSALDAPVEAVQCPEDDGRCCSFRVVESVAGPTPDAGRDPHEASRSPARPDVALV